MSEAKESKIIRFLSYAVPILLVVYVMSVGPAVAFVLDSNGEVERPEYVGLISSFYAPLTWAYDENKYVRDVLQAYIEICNGTY